MFEYNLDLSEHSYMRDYTADGTLAFYPRMLESGYFEAGNEYFTARDNKNAALLIYTVSGSGLLELKKQRLVLSPGSLILFRCNQEHSYKTLTGPWCFHWYHCDLESLSGYGDLLCDTLLHATKESCLKLNEIFYRIKVLADRSDAFSCGYRSGHISESFSVMLRLTEATISKTVPKSVDIEKTLQYINDNLSMQIDLDTLAELAHISKYHFIRVFRKYTGYSPYKYIMTARINKAKLLLTTTQMPVGAIAEAVGFPESANFSKVFRIMTGQTPSVYRKEHYRM